MARVASQQLGVIDVPEDKLLSFPNGLPGFLHAKEFCLVEVRAGSRFRLLQCTHDANLAFVITDPLLLDAAYPMDSVRRHAVLAGFDEKESFAVGVIVTVPPPPARATANLMAPVVMGLEHRVGLQLVLLDSTYDVRHAL